MQINKQKKKQTHRSNLVISPKVKNKIISIYYLGRVHRLVVNRDPKFTNFGRRYAGLFFSLCVDITDNELAYLESIHLFVEILDHFFSNVCELDLVFNFHKVSCEETSNSRRTYQLSVEDLGPLEEF
ncbi:hypothetical protein ACJIZ3_014051 [Penstemon smallii]|uniref:AP complex mu/sigma subunit domain-containing protein n=1 Tax=Penstemon smallii TaxID=265156 RepID=A0ABD3RIS6_9LAMI